jgi:hypothetical protein
MIIKKEIITFSTTTETASFKDEIITKLKLHFLFK